jgi:hypothetical protein
VIKQVRRGRGHFSPWLVQLVNRKPAKLAAVALANKTARIAWKLMVSGERYDRMHNRARPQDVDREGRSAAPDGGSAQHPSLRPHTAPAQALALGQG